MHTVGIIGCGAIGLTTALLLQENCSSAVNVTIFTEDVSPNTTGDVSAGLWTPYSLLNTPQEDIIKWSKSTLDYLIHLWRNGKAKEAGISLIPITNLTTEKPYKIPEWTKIALGLTHLSSDELDVYRKRFKKKFTGGYSYVAFTWEPSVFLPYFQKIFLENGGKIVRQRITDFEQLNDFDVIVNCTGLGARDLLNDEKITAVRGQVLRVDAPWQFHSIVQDEQYIIPNMKWTTLGGTKQADDFDIAVRINDKKRILQNCYTMEPSLMEASHLGDMVGLRPGRDRVRLELEMIKLLNRDVPVVHNYGHGGSGITLAYGCALEACELVKEALNITSKCKL